MKKNFDRICVLVLDGFGVGALEDAAKFGDEGANTLGHILEVFPNLHIPHLQSLGLKELGPQNKSNSQALLGYFSKMREISAGKDTTTGHWEMMGLPVQKAFDTFPQGFPADLMESFVKENQLPGYLGNYPASGTEIIEKLGLEHIQTKKPIVYTSADSVFQIAAHEVHFGLDRLMKLCEKTREILNQSGFLVGRVIARPFIGEKPGEFKRTGNRRDFSVKPFGETVLTKIKAAQLPVIGIGKISYIYDGEGITESIHTHSDKEGIDTLRDILTHRTDKALVFANLNDLDTLYGHRRNTQGYARQLENIDQRLPEIFSKLNENDLLIISSDHGNDPGFKGTDHTREYVPLLIYSPRFQAEDRKKRQLDVRECFCDIGETILDNFGLKGLGNGKSFLSEL